MFEDFFKDATEESTFMENFKNMFKAKKMKAYEMDNEDKDGNKYFVTGKTVKKYNKKSGMVYKADGKEEGHISAYEMYDSEKALQKEEKAVSKAVNGNPHGDDPVADPKVAGTRSEETDKGMASAHGGKKMKKSLGEMDVDDLKEMIGDAVESKISEMVDEDDIVSKALTIDEDEPEEKPKEVSKEDPKEVKKAEGMLTEEFKGLLGDQIEKLDSGESEDKSIIKAQSDTINELKASMEKISDKMNKYLKTPNDVTATITGEADNSGVQKELSYSGVMHKAMELVKEKKIALTDIAEIELSIQSNKSVPQRLEHFFAPVGSN